MIQAPHSATHPLTEELIEGTVVWLFWRKVLKLRNYRPLMRVVDVYKTEKSIRSEVLYYFDRAINKTILVVHISKNDGLHFRVARQQYVYQSPICSNIGQFEDEFKRYFMRRLPIMPAGVGLMPGSDNLIKKDKY